jgi:hypothetical protein
MKRKPNAPIGASIVVVELHIPQMPLEYRSGPAETILASSGANYAKTDRTFDVAAAVAATAMYRPAQISCALAATSTWPGTI